MKKWQYSLLLTILFLILGKLSVGWMAVADFFLSWMNGVIGILQLYANE